MTSDILSASNFGKHDELVESRVARRLRSMPIVLCKEPNGSKPLRQGQSAEHVNFGLDSAFEFLVRLGRRSFKFHRLRKSRGY